MFPFLFLFFSFSLSVFYRENFTLIIEYDKDFNGMDLTIEQLMKHLIIYNVKEIPSYTFFTFYNIETVFISDSVEIIGDKGLVFL